MRFEDVLLRDIFSTCKKDSGEYKPHEWREGWKWHTPNPTLEITCDKESVGMAGAVGIEPTTFGFGDRRSTN